MGSFKDLKAWQRSMDLVEAVYKATSAFPAEERYALANQMRRSSISITSNIAEGYGRGTDKELIHFLYMARGSSNELCAQIDLSKRLSYINDDVFSMLDTLNMEINKMLSSLIYRRLNGMDSFIRTETELADKT
ncbi:MAG: four helix bundle protein [Bacteroidaceae bacterium]|nr:four helix bundle protein [Bacteroidaceae bacterium]